MNKRSLRMRFTALFLLACSSMASASNAQNAVPVRKPEPPIAGVEHVLIISIDGLRPDRMLICDAPVLRGLLKEGAYTMWARTIVPAITLPAHASMLTGVNERKHGIEWNRDLPLKEPVYPRVPTIFEMAAKAGCTTAMIAGKSKFSALNKPGTINHVFVPDEYEPDSTKANGSNSVVLERAVSIIEKHKPALTFVHLPDVDVIGHQEGWGSPGQSAVIEQTDADVGKVFAALDRAGIREKTIVIVTADHGGAGRTHGQTDFDDMRSRHIPWIITGPGVRASFDLTQVQPLQVSVMDTAATSLWLLGLLVPPNLDGKPVKAAFVDAK